MNISFLIANLGVRGSIRRIVELSNNLILRGHYVNIYHSDGSPCSWLSCSARTLPELQALSDEHDCLIYFGDPEHWDIVRNSKSKVKALYLLGLDERLSNLKELLLGIETYDRRTTATSEAIASKDILLLSNCLALHKFLINLRRGVNCYPVIGSISLKMFYPRKVKRNPYMVLAGGAKRDIEGTQVVLDAMEIIKKNRPQAFLELYAARNYSQERLAELYSTAGVFVDAQRYGGWNNPVAEAMACGCPVVCNNIWGNRDFARNQKTALIAEQPLKIAQAVCQLIDNPQLGKTLAKKAYNIIKPYTWEHATDQLEFAINRTLR